MPNKFNPFTNQPDFVNSTAGMATGPAISTDNAVVRFDGTTGALLQNSGTTLSDADLLSTGELNLTTVLAVQYGGTGGSSFTDGAYLIGNASGAIAELDGTAKGTIPVGDGTSVPTALGVGADNQVLTADSTEPSGLKWATSAGGGDVVKVGTPVDSQIGVWTGDGTIEGDTALTFDTSTDTLAIAASGKLAFGAVNILSDSAGTMTLSNVDALDATTESTIEAAIDTLANLTSASSLSITESQISDLQSYLLNVVEDTTPQLGGALDGQGNDLNNLGVAFLTEQAAAEVDVAGKVQLWAKTATPNQFWYTDDAGTDFQVASLDGTETFTNKTINTASNTITVVEADISDLQNYVVGPGSAVDNEIVRFDSTTGVLVQSSGANATTTLSDNADLTLYDATNDGNPEIRLGASDAEELHVQTVYDGAAQTLDYVLFQTDAASATANKGLYRFNVDGTDICDIDDGGIDLDSGMALSIAGTDVLNATTLGSGVTGSSLTSVGTISSGTWQGTTIAVDQGGSGQTTYTDGQLLIGNSTGNTLAKATLTATADETSITNGSGSITIGIADNPVLPGTEGVQIPSGTTAQRPGVPVNGDLRYNSTDNDVECYVNSSWTSLTSGTADSVSSLSDTTITGAAKGDMLVYNGSAWVDLTVGSNDQVLTADSAQSTGIKWAAAAGGSMPSFVKQWEARALDPVETNYAPLEQITTTSIIQRVRAFDRATIEYVNGQFEVPPDIDTSGTVTFTLKWFARVVPGSSEDVVWQVEHAAVADTEDLDSATFTAEVATADGTGTTQNALIRTTWTETVTNLGWVAGDTVFIRWSRKATDASDTFDNNATQTNDDALMIHAAIIIPQA